MKNVLKTFGISLILLTSSFFTNTSLADDIDDPNDLGLNISSSGTTTALNWIKPRKNKYSSYKVYISQPVSQAEIFSTEIPVGYVEGSSKLNAKSTSYVFTNLEKGKYYRFMLEAYKNGKLVDRESIGSTVLADGYEKPLGSKYPFTCSGIDQNTLKISWKNKYEDDVQRTMKFYRIDDGYRGFGSVDLKAETYTFENLDPNEIYHIAGEIYEGDKMIFTYQFGIRTNHENKESSQYYLHVEAEAVSDTQIDLTPRLSGKTGGKIEYKTEVSKPLSSEEFYANKDLDYKEYSFSFDYNAPTIFYYAPYEIRSGNYDQNEIYKKVLEGLTIFDRERVDSDVFSVSVPEVNKYYRINMYAYYNGKLLDKDDTWVRIDSTERNNLFHNPDSEDEFEGITSRDGTSADITWENRVEEWNYPKGERTVYFYLSSPHEEMLYDYSETSATYIGKTDYSMLQYRIDGLIPGKYYKLYMEVRYKEGVEDNFSVAFDTRLREPDLELSQIKKDSVTLYAGNGSYNGESWYFYTNGLIPEGFEYFKKGKNGKYKKIGTATIGKSFVDKKLSVGKTYKYKARAYATIDGKKTYSGFSSVESIKIYNFKPVLKIKFVDKKKKIVKITSDKYNDEIEFGEFDPNDMLHGSNIKKLKKGRIIINPGETVYVKLLKKKVKNVDLYSYTTDSYCLTLDFNKCTYKLKKQK